MSEKTIDELVEQATRNSLVGDVDDPGMRANVDQLKAAMRDGPRAYGLDLDDIEVARTVLRTTSYLRDGFMATTKGLDEDDGVVVHMSDGTEVEVCAHWALLGVLAQYVQLLCEEAAKSAYGESDEAVGS